MTTVPYSSAPLRPSQRPTAPPSPAEVLAFCEAGHTNHEAAERWRISERYVRKLKARARNQDRAEDRQPTVEVSRPATLSDFSEALPKDPKATTPVVVFPETNGADVAGDHTMWKDPWTGELLSPPPGSIRREWEAERRAAQARHVASLLSPEPEQPAQTSIRIEVPPEQDRPAEQPSSASASAVPARNTGSIQDLQVRPIPPVQVVTRVVRVPVEPPASPLVAWLKDHAPPVQLVTAIVAFLFLVALTWIG